MSQRKNNDEKKKHDPRLYQPLRKTKTITHDLDRHLLMLDIIPTTHKTDLNKMVKK